MTPMMRVLKHSRRLAAAAVLLVVCAVPAATASTGYTTRGAWSFVSAPKLHPPKLSTDIPTAAHGLASGYFLVANFVNLTSPKQMVGQGGPLILDSHLQPVWFAPVPAGQYSNNLTEQTYNGKPALSWWQGVVTNTGATTSGEDIVVDQHYQPVATLKAAPGWVITQHEMIIQGHNAWVTANSAPGAYPTRTVNGKTVQVIDSAVQEYDLTTGKLLYSWSALANVPVSQVQQPVPSGVPWDAYHVNSIQLLPGGAHGQFLVSLRNTWAAYRVDVATNNTLWTLGGAASDFPLKGATAFQWQHDVQLHSGGLVSLFDDACCAVIGPGKLGAASGQSRGLLLRINPATHTVSYVHSYAHPGMPIYTAFQGGMQLLPNRNVIVGWGSAPFFSEFSYSAKPLLDAALPFPDVSYRAYVASWVGMPLPSALAHAVKTSHGKPTVYVSWDGATEVVAWRVLGGSSAKHLRLVATSTKSSFETAIGLKRSYHTYELQAVDARGHVLVTSKPFGAGAGKPVYGGY